LLAFAGEQLRRLLPANQPPKGMNAMRTFDVVPVIRLQSDQHRIELPIFIKWLLFQMISFDSWS
jgi:hypothetical protein